MKTNMYRTISLTRATARLVLGFRRNEHNDVFTLMALSLFLFTPTVSRGAIQASAHASAGLVRIAIVGDSTVADYKLDDPHRGWGQLFPEFVDTRRVSVQNFAVNGRSTKTFKSEGRWERVLAFKPDYIFIQFGHNDSHAKGRPESTDAETDYSRYLREYVESASAQGATPILVTPMHRGTWDIDGRHLTQELLPYADAMGRVAKERRVPVIDLYTLSAKTFEQLGSEQLKTLFAFPDSDKTHFNEKGARLLATLVARETARHVPTLKTYLKVTSPPGSSGSFTIVFKAPSEKQINNGIFQSIFRLRMTSDSSSGWRRIAIWKSLLQRANAS